VHLADDRVWVTGLAAAAGSNEFVEECDEQTSTIRPNRRAQV
jgi:hypothetical protein